MMKEITSIKRGCFNCSKKFMRGKGNYYCSCESTVLLSVQYLGDAETLLEIHYDPIVQKHYRKGCNCDDYESEKERVTFT